MDVRDWQRIEDLFHEALSLTAETRGEYLTRACSGDAGLRAELDSLLAAYESRRGFMEGPAFDTGLLVLADSSNETLTGKKIGPYQILDPLGKGGMGEVYLAEDTRLGRKVALKFLASSLTDDRWARRQLVKEAQAVAMLEHLNICAIHGIEEAEGHSFIVMQYVEGESLAALLRRAPPDITQALSCAQPIVS